MLGEVNNKKWIATLSIVLILVSSVLSAGCMGGQQEEDGTDKKGGTLVSGIREEPESLNPYTNTRSIDDTILRMVTEGLVVMNEDFEAQPLLAKEWEWGDNKKEITFTLREGIKFHNGEELTAEDVKASLEMFVANQPIAGFYLTEGAGGITNMEVLSKYKIKLEFAEPRPHLMVFLEDGGRAAIMPKELIEQSKAGNVTLGRGKIIGTGPYKLTEWKSGDQVVLERYEDYDHGPDILKGVEDNKGPAHIEKRVYKIIPESTTRISALESGDVDVIFHHIPLKFLPSLEGNEKINVRSSPEAGVQYMSINANRTPTNDKNVRIAIAHAVNKTEILDKAWSGVGSTPAGIINNATLGYWSGVRDVAYKFDQEKAKQLLEQAGWIDEDGDGIREKNGEELKLTLITFSNLDQWRTAGVILQSQLKEVGINVEVDTAEVGAIYERGEQGDYHIIVAKILWWFGPGYLNFLCHSNSASYYANLPKETRTEIDEAIKQAMRATSEEEREEGMKKAQKLIIESAGWVPLVSRTQRVAYTDKVSGIDKVVQHPQWQSLTKALEMYIEE